MTIEPAQQLSIALTATERLIAAVRDDQWTEPTPCTDWNVRDLVEHVVGGNYRFARALRGEPPALPEDALRSGRDLLKAYRDSAAARLDAFRQPGVLERVFTIPVGTAPGVVLRDCARLRPGAHGTASGHGGVHAAGRLSGRWAPQHRAPVLRDGTRRTGIHDRTDALNTYCTSALGESNRNAADRGNQLRA